MLLASDAGSCCSEAEDLVPSTNPTCTLPEVHWAGWRVLGTWEMHGRCEGQSVGPPFCFEYVFQKNHCCQVPCFYACPATRIELFTMCFAGVSLLVYAARIDMIVGPPPPSTPRHKKYPTKGPTAPSRESPQYSPRLGCTASSRPACEWPAPLL